jgi:putative tryptophan/tyrosine transport system substrate-binding protein
VRPRRRDRRGFLQLGLLLAVLAMLSGCVLPPRPEATLPKVYRLGLFHVGLDHVPPSLQSLRDGLRELGYEEGKNIALDWRNLPDEEAANATARDFVRDRVDLIVAFENQTLRATKLATSEIPTVFLHVDDPVANGIVESYSRPGGNLTGFVGQPDLPDKRLQLFKEVVPTMRTVLVLADLRDPVTRPVLAATHRAAATIGLDLLEREASEASDLERIFQELRPGEADGIVIASQNLLVKHQGLILQLGLAKRMPLMSQRREWVEQGALVSYGANLARTGKAAASRYVDRILQGGKPSELPVEQADSLELVVNLKTAEALGLTVPRSVVLLATEIVQ